MMQLARLYSDATGESHFDDVVVELEPSSFAPPASPVDLSAPLEAARCFFHGLPQGWHGD